LAAGVQSVALVVIQIPAASSKREVGETTVDVAAAERQLIRIGEVKLRPLANVWRSVSSQPLMRAPLMVIGKKRFELLKLLWSK
jgi:hypothetical protein